MKIKLAVRSIVFKVCPPIRRLEERLIQSQEKVDSLEIRIKQLEKVESFLKGGESKSKAKILISRGGGFVVIDPETYDDFEFQHGDEIEILSPDQVSRFAITPDNNRHIGIGDRAIRVPPRMEFFDFKGYRIPVHLMDLTGAGPATWDVFGQGHIKSYAKFMGISDDMTFLEIGCGIGRDAFQLIDLLGDKGKYVGIDVTRDSILWCTRNISKLYPNFQFYHFDAKHELYNPLGSKTSMDFALPAADHSVDRIALGSIFTHLFEDEVVYYMKEIKRVLKPGGLAYATFFLYSDETISATRRKSQTHNDLMFMHLFGDGCYVNDPDYPTGAVAYTDDAMQRMIGQSGLKLSRPYLKGCWSGAYENGDDGQEVAILAQPS